MILLHQSLLCTPTNFQPFFFHLFNRGFIDLLVLKNNCTNEQSPAALAQLVERVAFNHVVVGLIPTGGVE